MPTEKTTYFDWDKPVFPSDNLATEFDTLFDQIDNTVNTITGSGWSVSNNGTEIISSPTDINFTTDIEVFDNGDGTISVSSTALSTSEKGAADGVAELDSSSKILSSQLPSLTITETDVVADKTERLALDAERGDVAIQQDKNQSYILKGTDPTLDSEWTVLQSPTSDLTSVFGRTGDVTAQSNDYTHDQIGGQASDDHHTRYSDSEAISAINTDTDHGSTASHNYFSGSHSDLSGIASDDHHTRYTGSEARSAVASEPVGRPSYTSLSNAPSTSLGDIFHVGGDGLYVDTDATTVDNTDTPLQTHLDDTNNPHNTTVNVPVDSVNGKTGAVTIDTQTQSRRENSFYARHQSSGSTSGGGSSWNTQKYNNVKHNQITGATFDTSTYKLTLPAGEYYVESEQNPYDSNECSMRLYNDTTGTVEIRGNSGYSGGNGSAAARVEGFLTLTQQSTLKLQLRTSNTTSYIFGVARNKNGMTTPIYAGKFYLEEL